MNCNIPTALEVYADRTYEDDATLTPRSINDSLITDPNSAREHVKSCLFKGELFHVMAILKNKYSFSMCSQ